VAVRGEVWADTTMGSVGSSASRNSALNDSVVDNALIDVKLGGLSVGLKVDKEFTDTLDRLLGPSTLSSAELSALSVTAHMSIEAFVWNNSLVLETRVHVLDGSLDFHTLDGTGSFVRVFEVSAQILDLSFSGCTKKEGQTLVGNEAKRDEKVLMTYTWQAQLAVYSI